LSGVTHKIVSEMTYNVSSGTLNSTIPYYRPTMPKVDYTCSVKIDLQCVPPKKQSQLLLA